MPEQTVDSARCYDQHTADYIARTWDADLRLHYARFVARLPAGDRILDAGCGSGRDSLAFAGMGFDVTAMDASTEMATYASSLLGRPALVRRHQEVDFEAAFDGVWSMASLLHVSQAELPGVLARYRDALVPGGVMFASFKHGSGEHIVEDRLFANQNRSSFERVIAMVPGLELLESEIDPDTRPDRASEEWFSVICQRRRGV